MSTGIPAEENITIMPSLTSRRRPAIPRWRTVATLRLVYPVESEERTRAPLIQRFGKLVALDRAETSLP